MKFFGALFALCCTIAVTLAAQAILEHAEHPDHPGKCYDADSKLVFEPEETKNIPGSCSQAYCSKSLSLTYTSCGSVVVDDPSCVKIEQDLSKDYPECCRKYKCEVDGKVTYF